MLVGHETVEIGTGVVQEHRVGSGRFQLIVGETPQEPVGRAGHVDDDGKRQELKKR